MLCAVSGDHTSSDQATVGSFLRWVQHRRALMLAGGGLAAAGAAVGIAAFHGGGFRMLDWLFGFVLACGMMVATGSFTGARRLAEATTLAQGPSRTLELALWPYRTSGRAIVKNAVLGTLDEMGSTERTPAVEFRAIWFTPGIGESPQSEAEVFGRLVLGSTVVVRSPAGCLVGRVTRTR